MGGTCDGTGNGDGGQTHAVVKAPISQTCDGIDCTIHGHLLRDDNVSCVFMIVFTRVTSLIGNSSSIIFCIQVVENSIDFCIMSPNVVEAKEQSDK